MNVSLTPELEAFVKEQVKSGQYRSASEAVREGLRLLVLRHEEHELKLAALRASIETGLQSLDAGEGIDGDEFFANLLAGLDQEG